MCSRLFLLLFFVLSLIIPSFGQYLAKEYIYAPTGVIAVKEGPVFSDVPVGHQYYSYIQVIYQRGITAGCAAAAYCPENPVTRAQMAVFLMKAKYGSSYVPPPATGSVFDDVPLGYWAGAWIEAFAQEGITAGCGYRLYCPENLVTRAQMSVFILKARYTSSYIPQQPTCSLCDVPTGYWAKSWICDAFNKQIASECSPGSPPCFCPENPVTRGEIPSGWPGRGRMCGTGTRNETPSLALSGHQRGGGSATPDGQYG